MSKVVRRILPARREVSDLTQALVVVQTILTVLAMVVVKRGMKLGYWKGSCVKRVFLMLRDLSVFHVVGIPLVFVSFRRIGTRLLSRRDEKQESATGRLCDKRPWSSSDERALLLTECTLCDVSPPAGFHFRRGNRLYVWRHGTPCSDSVGSLRFDPRLDNRDQVIFLHGMVCSGRFWNPFVEALQLSLEGSQKRCQFIVPDLLGFGRSPWPRLHGDSKPCCNPKPTDQTSTYSIREQCDWLLRDALSGLTDPSRKESQGTATTTTKLHIVGHSFGAAIAMHLAARLMEESDSLDCEVASLTLISLPYCGDCESDSVEFSFDKATKRLSAREHLIRHCWMARLCLAHPCSAFVICSLFCQQRWFFLSSAYWYLGMRPVMDLIWFFRGLTNYAKSLAWSPSIVIPSDIESRNVVDQLVSKVPTESHLRMLFTDYFLHCYQSCLSGLDNMVAPFPDQEARRSLLKSLATRIPGNRLRVLHGSADEVVPFLFAKSFVEAVNEVDVESKREGRVELELVQDIGHALPLEAPHRVFEVLREQIVC